MAENKTKPTDVSVDDYLSSKASAQQLADARQLMNLLQRVTGHPATMWGPSIVGYGSYRYTYESGRMGEAPLVGFAIRGREMVVYVMAEGEGQQQLLPKLGRHKMGKACLYFKQLSDLDLSVLEQLVTHSVIELQRRST